MSPIAIESVGMITPAAGDAAGCVEAMRGSACGSTGRALAATSIPADVAGLDRFVELGSYVLWEAIHADLATGDIALLVCAPSEIEDGSLAGESQVLLERLAAEAELSLAPQDSQVLALGRNGIFRALELARTIVMRPTVAGVCVLGVDSLITAPRLERMRAQGKVIGEGSWTPGEAAAAVVLTQHPGASSLALLHGLGFADDPSVAQNGQSHCGTGLVTAVNAAVGEAGLGEPAFSGVAHDLADSVQAAAEMAEIARAFLASPPAPHVLPCACAGDAGAAMGALALAASAFLVGKEAWKGLGLCCLSSASRRGAAVLSASPRRRARS